VPDYQEIYAQHADQYEQLVSREDHEHHILPALQAIRPLDALSVVELGAGTGRLSCLLAPSVKSLHLLDASQHMLDVAAAKLARSGLHNWQIQVADHRRLPVEDRVADVVISGWSVCYLVVEHPDRWRAVLDQALREMKRVLRPGGTIVLLETLGTGHETPHPPTETLADYYAFLEKEGFCSTWIRTDYRFESLAEAEALTRFFFGDELAQTVVENEWVILPECTGIWWLDVSKEPQNVTFDLGRVEVTPAASAALSEAGVDLSVYMARHRRGDWGDVEDWARPHNAWALEYQGIIRSTYKLPDGTSLSIATACDRSYTRVILEQEFERREVSAQEGYARWAETYDHERNPLIAVEEPLVDAILQELEVATALDVGAGTGRLALKLARRGVAVTAIDPSAEMLAVAEQNARREGLAIDFRLGSLDEGLPFAPAAFDLVTCALALCHVPDLDGAAREFYRVLREGGYLLITDFHPDAVADMGWRTVAVRPEGRYLLPNMPYSRADYLQAVEKQGFTLLDVQDVPVREVPPECLAFYEHIVSTYGDCSFCLIVFAQR
jgi:ubiquinone/menaquinone biosynthesis C-methylase UbiE